MNLAPSGGPGWKMSKTFLFFFFSCCKYEKSRIRETKLVLSNVSYSILLIESNLISAVRLDGWIHPEDSPPIVKGGYRHAQVQ